MANERITDLPNGTAPGGSEPFESVQGGNSVYFTLLQLAAFIQATTLNNQTGTSYTLAVTDNLVYITITNASAITLTVPTNASVAIPVGGAVVIEQGGAGQITVVAAGGVTVNSFSSFFRSAGQYAQFSLTKKATNTWTLAGNLTT